MSTFDEASLVLIPSGYKASKVYSVKPTDGTGDLVFTRSLDTATRVGPDGLIEKVRTNIATHSEQFDDASYGKFFTSVTANATTSPTGTLTADKLVEDSTLNVHAIFRNQTLSVGFVSYSFFAKPAGRSKITALRTSVEIAIFQHDFDLVAGTASGGGIIEAAANGFFRCSGVMEVVTGGSTGVFVSMDNGTGTTYTGDGVSGVFLWGFQYELSDFGATPYIPTTTSVESTGMLANVPRLDYLGGGCPKLILEPQRVNLITFSEQLNNAAWTKNTASIVANVATSPAGFLDADRLVPDSGSGGDARQTLAHTTGSALTISYFVKKESSLNLVGITILGNASVSFDLDTNAFATLALLNGWTLGNTSFDDYGNGWKRVKVTFVAGTTGSSVTRVVEVRSTGDGTQGVLFYGCQAEAGSFATSYIPTLAAAVTRSADAASKTGISALIGQTEGTLFVDYLFNENTPNLTSNDNILLGLNDGTTNNLILIIHYGSSASVFGKKIRFFVRTSGATQALIESSAQTSGRYKVAVTYASNSFKLFVNGVLIGEDISGNVPATSAVFLFDLITNLGTLQNHINQALLFPTRLTNAQLEELTA